MRLINKKYLLDIELQEQTVFVIYIEKQCAFTDMVTELWKQCDNGDGAWILSESGNEINISKTMICIVNPISLDLNDKKLLKILYQDMSEDVQDNMYEEFGAINSHIISFIDYVVQNQPYAIDFDDGVSLADLLKICDVRFADESDNLLDKITSYLKLWHRVAKIKVFAFVNLKAYLSTEEVEQLYEMVRYEQICLILIESSYNDKLIDETVKIIDRDLCIIDC